MALFGEKYGDVVRTITIGSSGGLAPAEQVAEVACPGGQARELPRSKYSYELCGGTHLERTSDVGAFIIVREEAAAAGVRRIEAESASRR